MTVSRTDSSLYKVVLTSFIDLSLRVLTQDFEVHITSVTHVLDRGEARLLPCAFLHVRR